MNTISKKTQSLTTAEDMRNQTKLMMQPYANWEEYLAPAPLSIAILGELVFISAKADFSINDKPPIGGYKFIKYPDSFRACLMQVCNSVWWAFNEAHNNMDQIRLHTARVPDYMKTAVSILFEGDDEVVEALLPDQLENIRVVADECVALSEATENCFAEVIKTTGELLEVCMSAQNSYTEKLEETKKKLAEAKLREKSAQEAKKTERLMRGTEKEMKEARDRYQKALDSIPSGWQMIGMDFVGGIAQSITGNLDRMPSVEKLEKNEKVTMRNCELKEIDFKTTIKMLDKEMDTMGRVKEQWHKMVRFFQMILNLFFNNRETSLSTTLKDFALTSEKTQHLLNNAKLFSKDLLYKQASQACNIASLVHMISGTYTDISDKYLMGRVSSLSKLMAMDKSKPEFKHAQEQLRNVCDTTQKAILNCVLENKQEFERKSKARIEKIDRELLAILPAAPPEKTKMIEEAIKAGFSEEEEASYY